MKSKVGKRGIPRPGTSAIAEPKTQTADTRQIRALALTESELRYRRLFEAAQDGILILDAETGLIEDVNPYLISMLGYSREEFLKKKLWEVGAFKDIEASKDAFVALQDKEYIRYEDLPLKAKDGRLIQVEFVSNVYVVGGEKVIQCNIRDVTEYKRIIAALKYNEKKYHDLVNQSPDGMFIIELPGRMVTVNKAMCRELGYTEEEFLSMNIWDLIPEQYLEQYKERLTRILQGESLREAGEYAVRGKDEKLHYVEVLSAPHYTGKDIIGFYGIARDLTERKRSEENLRLNEEKYRTLIEQINDGVYSTDAAGVYTFANSGLARIYGVANPEELLGRKFTELAVTSRHSEISQAYNSAMQNGSTPEVINGQIERSDGTLAFIEVKPTMMYKAGLIVGSQGIVRDVTDRKRAEEVVRESEKRFRALIENSSDAITLVDSQGRAIYDSPAAPGMLGYASEDWIGKQVFELVHPDDLPGVQELFKKLNDAPGTHTAKAFRVHHKDGSWVWIDAVATNLLDEPSVKAIVVNYRDITERKQAEEAVRENEHQMQALVSSLDDIVIEFEENGTYRNIWTSNETLLPRPKAEMLGRGASEVVGEELANQILESSRRVRVSGQSEDIEYPLDVISGRRWFLARISPIPAKEGTSKTFCLLIRDITERKEAEQALRESEGRFSRLAQASFEGLAIHDNAGILEANQPLADLFGYELSEMNGMNPLDLAAPESRELVQKNILADIQTSYEAVGIKKDGTKFPGEVIGKSAQYLGRTARATAIRDITGRKQTEARIQRQLEHLTALSAIDRVISSNFDLRLSLAEILRHVTTELGVDAADVLILNPATQILVFGAERGFHTQAIREAQVHMGANYAGRIAVDRQLVSIPDLRDVPEGLFSTAFVKDEGFVSYFGLPLIAKGQVNGVLEVFHHSRLSPDPEWIDFLHALAGQAAIAIENSTLFENFQRSNLELTLAYDATIEGWSHALDLRDKETEGHTQRVTEMTVKLARSFGLSEPELMQVRWGALLHDIGKMGVPDHILLKPGSLTDEEWIAMRKHPGFAYEMLAPIRYLRLALDIPYCHHEKWDGSGYPRGLMGDQIPLAARIFTVVDVWDALMSDRPYRPAWTLEKARLYIREESGTYFDPQVVEVFLRDIADDNKEASETRQ